MLGYNTIDKSMNGIITLSDGTTIIENGSISNVSNLDAANISATNLSTNAIIDIENEIQTNTTNISTNTSNIATNTSNIATNTSNIATNTANISTNASSITNLQGQINEIDTDVDPYPILFDSDWTACTNGSEHVFSFAAGSQVVARSKLNSDMFTKPIRYQLLFTKSTSALSSVGNAHIWDITNQGLPFYFQFSNERGHMLFCFKSWTNISPNKGVYNYALKFCRDYCATLYTLNNISEDGDTYEYISHSGVTLENVTSGYFRLYLY